MAKKGWESKSIIEYWGETAASKHVVQIYESHDLLLDALEGFSRSGLNSGESLIFIARKKVLAIVQSRLEAFGFDTTALSLDGRLILLDASEVLMSFMVGGMPERTLFYANIKEAFDRAKGPKNRKVRAFGEMVSILWQENNMKATIALEELWNDFCGTNKLTLFCAYPAKIFEDLEENLPAICNCHDHLLSGSASQRLNVHFLVS